MGTVIRFIRISTDKREVDRQRLTVYELARQKDLRIDDWVEMTFSGRRGSMEPRIATVMGALKGATTRPSWISIPRMRPIFRRKC